MARGRAKESRQEYDYDWDEIAKKWRNYRKEKETKMSSAGLVTLCGAERQSRDGVALRPQGTARREKIGRLRGRRRLEMYTETGSETGSKAVTKFSCGRGGAAAFQPGRAFSPRWVSAAFGIFSQVRFSTLNCVRCRLLRTAARCVAFCAGGERDLRRSDNCPLRDSNFHPRVQLPSAIPHRPRVQCPGWFTGGRLRASGLSVLEAAFFCKPGRLHCRVLARSRGRA